MPPSAEGGISRRRKRRYSAPTKRKVILFARKAPAARAGARRGRKQRRARKDAGGKGHSPARKRGFFYTNREPTKGATHLFAPRLAKHLTQFRGAGEGNARGGAGAEWPDPRRPRGGTRQGKGDGARPAARRPPPDERPRLPSGSAMKGRKV